MSGEAELAAAVDEWADALKILGEELLKVASVAPWTEIFVNLFTLSATIVGTVGCFIVNGYLAGAFAYRGGEIVAGDGCCGGAAALELDFDPVTQLLVPMVKGVTWLTVAITGFVVAFGPTFVGQIPNFLEIGEIIADNLCDLG